MLFLASNHVSTPNLLCIFCVILVYAFKNESYQLTYSKKSSSGTSDKCFYLKLQLKSKETELLLNGQLVHEIRRSIRIVFDWWSLLLWKSLRDQNNEFMIEIRWMSKKRKRLELKISHTNERKLTIQMRRCFDKSNKSNRFAIALELNVSACGNFSLRFIFSGFSNVWKQEKRVSFHVLYTCKLLWSLASFTWNMEFVWNPMGNELQNFFFHSKNHYFIDRSKHVLQINVKWLVSA